MTRLGGNGLIAQKQFKSTIMQLLVFRSEYKSSHESIGIPSISMASSIDNSAQQVSSFNFSNRKKGDTVHFVNACKGFRLFFIKSIKGMVSVIAEKHIK
nr:hypothetical protein [Rummeliibacillus stabekisii]